MSVANSNIPEFSVTEFSKSLKSMVESQYAYIRIRGELSNCKIAASGHLYCSLKDDLSALDGVCWRGQVSKLNFSPVDGCDVVCTGRITTYAGRSKYQIVIEKMELAGEGALLKMLEERKKKLAAEGLFDENNKKPIPFLPQTIAVVTSPTGAVIRDILHRISERFPCHVLLWPVQVQGESAAREIVNALKQINEIDIHSHIPKADVIILARGGGSLEDLMAFNEESVVRAIASSKIPLISAVGHETDWTLSDFVADLRAPTPTGAAEKAVPERMALWQQLLDFQQRFLASQKRYLLLRTDKLHLVYRAIPKPHQILDEYFQSLDDKYERCKRAIDVLLHNMSSTIEKISLQMKSPSEHLLHVSQNVYSLNEKAKYLIVGMVNSGAQKYTHYEDRFLSVKMESFFTTCTDKLSLVIQQGQRLLEQHYKRDVQELKYYSHMLESYSYQQVLSRGFMLAYDENDHAISSVHEIADPIKKVTLQFRDGKVSGLFTKKSENSYKRPKGKKKPSQLKLF